MTFSPEVFKKLLSTFQTELDEGVNTLVNGLVELENADKDSSARSAMIESLFRTAHNLKGASRGLGISAVGDIAHQMESLFSIMKSSNDPIAKQTINNCLEAADKMLEAMRCFVEKKPLSFNIDELNNRISKPIDSTMPPNIQHRHAESSHPANQHFSQTSLQSIRVPLRVIDKLSELSEEIQASKIIINNHSRSAKLLTIMMREFSGLWKDFNVELDNISNDKNFSRFQKLLLRANDNLMRIQSYLEKLSINMTAQSVDYARLSKSIMDEVALMRLVPVKNTLTYLPRVVRELADELHKTIHFNIEGGDVYIDKYVLEGLKDPVNHIIRNAIDHGIEPSDVRERLGKPPEGNILIKVMDAGNKVHFEISDDGAGINYKKIREMIRKKNNNLLSEVDTLNDEQIANYIFQSGFTTKSDVSIISGRGVGMDAVKKNVQLLKGSIDLKSKEGQGTTFTITVPLSLSSDRGLIVKCDDQYFVIPTYSIDRVITVTERNIINIEGSHAILVDNQPIALTSLSNIIGIGKSLPMDQIRCAVIVKVTGMSIAIGVDQVIGEREIVIKPIEEPLDSIPAVLGATLLDGNQIAIIFHPHILIELALSSFAKDKKNDLMKFTLLK